MEKKRRPVIAVVGGEDVSFAYDLGRLIAEKDWVLITGGRGVGVMKAANEGARAAGGLTIGILPNHNTTGVSADVDVAVVTDIGNARNNIIVLSAGVVVACGVGGSGTASEVSLALKNEKPVVLLGASEEAVSFFKSIGGNRVYLAKSAQDVVSLVNQILGL